MQKIEMNPPKIITIGALLFFMFLTRFSHELTSFSMPDASLIIFFAAGLLFKPARLLALFIFTIIFIDSLVIYKENYTEIGLLNVGYLLHLSIYPLAWFVASRLKITNFSTFSQSILWVILLSFLISYGSHYYLYILSSSTAYSLLSFFQDNLWTYLLSNIGYAIILFVILKAIRSHERVGLEVSSN